MTNTLSKYGIAVDRNSYDKRARFAAGHGYHVRTQTTPQLQGILLHTTNNPQPNKTTFGSEAFFLYTSKDVSAHYLLGKEGQCVRFLHPMQAVAWHAGVCKAGWDNNRAIGIEMHWTRGEAQPSRQMLDALTMLCMEICWVYKLPPTAIETHAFAALPAGRKHDPSFWTREQFLAWRTHLVNCEWPAYQQYLRTIGAL